MRLELFFRAREDAERKARFLQSVHPENAEIAILCGQICKMNHFSFSTAQ